MSEAVHAESADASMVLAPAMSLRLTRVVSDEFDVDLLMLAMLSG